MKVSKIGMAWYREGEYDEFRKLFTDGDGLPKTYGEWLDKAENGLNKLSRNGHVVVKAYLHIQTFPEWCRSRGLEINSAARLKFANEFAMRDDSQES